MGVKDYREILALRDDLVTHYSGAHAVMKQAKDYYDLKIKHVPKVSKNFDPYIPPTARSIVDKAVDHIIVGNPVITVPPQVADRKKYQARADKLEKFYTALFKRFNAFSKEPFLKTATKFALLCGLYVIKGPLWEAPGSPKRRREETLKQFRGREEEYKEGKSLNLPIWIKSLDPATVLFPPTTFPPDYVIESTRKDGRWLKARWPDANIKDGDVEWLEYWDNKGRCFLCDGVPVRDLEENIYGYIPYLLGYSGLGYQSEKPEDEIVGILNPVFSALESEARCKTAIDYMVQTHAYPIPYADTDAAKIFEGFEIGQILEKPKGVEIGFLPLPASLPDTWRLAQQIGLDIEKATYSDVLHGIRPEGVASGYQEAILVGQARLKFGSLVDSLELQASQLLSRVARLIEIVGESISVWAYQDKRNINETVGPEDIDGHYTVYVKLSAVSPEEADRKALLGLKLYQAGTISLLYFLENYAMIPNATEEAKQIMIEQVLKNPQIFNALAMTATKEWDRELFAETLKTTAVGASSELPIPGQSMPGSLEEAEMMIRKQQRLGGLGQGGELGSPAEGP